MALYADPAALAATVLKALPPAKLRGRTDPVRSFARLLVENLLVGLLVLTVIVSSDQVNEPWHSLTNAVIALALVGYAIRLTLSQHRRQKELRVRQQAETTS